MKTKIKDITVNDQELIIVAERRFPLSKISREVARDLIANKEHLCDGKPVKDRSGRTVGRVDYSVELDGPSLIIESQLSENNLL
jgi:hypothetical protein